MEPRPSAEESVALVASGNAGASSLFHDIELQKRQALDVARAAIHTAEVSRFEADRLLRMRYALVLLFFDVVIIGFRYGIPSFVVWHPALTAVISAAEVMLIITLFVTAWQVSAVPRALIQACTIVRHVSKTTFRSGIRHFRMHQVCGCLTVAGRNRRWLHRPFCSRLRRL